MLVNTRAYGVLIAHLCLASSGEGEKENHGAARNPSVHVNVLPFWGGWYFPMISARMRFKNRGHGKQFVQGKRGGLRCFVPAGLPATRISSIPRKMRRVSSNLRM